MMIDYSSVNVHDDDVTDTTNTNINIERTKMNVDSYYYDRVLEDGNNNIDENNNQTKLIVSEGTYLLSNERVQVPVVVLEEQEDDSTTINKSNNNNNNNNNNKKHYINYNSTVININNTSTINKKTKEKELQSKKEIRGMIIDMYNKPMDNKKDTKDNHDNDDEELDYDDIYVPQFLIPSSSNRNYNNFDNNSSRNNTNDDGTSTSSQIERQQHRNNNNNNRRLSLSSSSSSSQRPSFRMRSIYVNAIVLTIVFCIWVVSFMAVVLHPSPQQQQKQQQVRNQKEKQQQEQIQTIPKYHNIHSRLTIDEQIDLLDEWKSQWHRPTTSIGTTTTAPQQHDHSKTSSSTSSSSMLLSSSSLLRNPSITTTTTTTTTTTLTSTGTSTSGGTTSTVKKEIDTYVHPPPMTFPPSNRSIIYLNTTTAFAMLLSSDDNDILTFSSDYFTITASGWDAQINQAYCGVASTSAVLNSYKDNIWLVHSRTPPSTSTSTTTTTPTPTEANTTTTSSTTVPTSVSATATTSATTIDGIPIDYHLPIDDRYSPYMYATQPVILNGSINECVQQNVVYYNTTYDGVYNVPGGLSLYQVQQLLHCHLQKALPDHATFTVQVQEVNPISITIDTMRQELINALQDPYKRCIINFNRLGIQQYGGGHFSPLGSYNKQYDMFLLLDVAKYKYSPVWVSTADLYNAMSTIDKCGKWNFPLGQFDTTIIPYLNRFDLYYTNQTLLYQLLTNLGCTSTYRGYIITEIIIPPNKINK